MATLRTAPAAASAAALLRLSGFLALAGCGGGSESVAPPGPSVAAGATYGIVLSDLQIASALYQDAQRTPIGFYADPAPAGESYVATVHLKTSDVLSAPISDYELCTSDWNQALAWSEGAATYRGVYADLVNNSSTERYFEFDRVLPGTPVLYLRQRVYRCGYLNRSDSSVAIDSGPAGILNLKPVTAADLQVLSEYLWRFTAWNNYGSAVLRSAAVPTSTGLAHQLLIATLVTDGAGAGCDRINVVRWEHRLDSANGALQRSLESLWSFNAHQVGSGAASCGASI